MLRIVQKARHVVTLLSVAASQRETRGDEAAEPLAADLGG